MSRWSEEAVERMSRRRKTEGGGGETSWTKRRRANSGRSQGAGGEAGVTNPREVSDRDRGRLWARKLDWERPGGSCKAGAFPNS